MHTPIRIGIVGCGMIANMHAHALNAVNANGCMHRWSLRFSLIIPWPDGLRKEKIFHNLKND